MMRREKKQDGVEGEDKARNKSDKASANLGVQGWGALWLVFPIRVIQQYTGMAGPLRPPTPSHSPGIVTQ